jgi:hypothetical protein
MRVATRRISGPSGMATTLCQIGFDTGLNADENLALTAAAALGAVQHLIPIPRPLFAPSEGLSAGLTNFLRQACLTVVRQRVLLSVWIATNLGRL